MRTRSARYSAVAASILLAASGQAQTIDWDNALGGTWNLAGNWSPLNIPDAAGESARISIPGTYLVTVDSNTSIDELMLENPNATVRVTGARALFLNGTDHTNNGTILVNTAAAVATYIQFLTDGTSLTGSGTLTLQGTNGFNDTAYLYSTAGINFTNGSAHSIDGVGRIYAGMVNEGVVEANVDGQTLFLFSLPKTNNNIMRAISGGDLRIDGITLTQGPGAVLSAQNDSTLTLNGATILGQTVESVGAGQVNIIGNTTFNNVTFNGSATLSGGRALFVSGAGLINTGVIRVNTGTAAGTYVHFTESGTLGGGGELLLQGSNGFNDTAYLYTTGAPVITHAADHRIHGVGRIYANLINNGVIEADVDNHAIHMISSPKTNNNVMRAVNGATLQIDGITITQSPSGFIRAEDDSTLVLTGATILDSVVESTGTGHVAITGNSILRDVTFNGSATLSGGRTLSITGSGLTNTGFIRVNTGTASGTTLQFNQPSTLDGGGEILLQGSSGLSDTAIIYTPDPASTLTLAPGTYIHGVGRIYAPIVNNALIEADVSGQAIHLLSANKTNNTTIRAKNGATLQFDSHTITQAPTAQLRAEDGSTLNFNGATVDNGHIITGGSGHVGVVGNTTLRSVHFDGSATVTGGRTLTVEGSGLDNDGVIRINTGTASGTHLNFSQTGSLTGSGQIRLQGSAGPSDTAYINTTGGQVVTQSATHTIRGKGRIYAQLVNNGSILADEPGSFIELLVAAKTNNAAIAAFNGGTIQLNNFTLTQGPSGFVACDSNSAINIGSATISGGTLNPVGASVATVTANSVFADLTSLGSVQIVGGRTLVLDGAGNTNSGTIIVNTQTASGTILQVNSTQTINGTGEIRLRGTGANDTAYLNTAGGVTATWGPGQKLTGKGRVYGSHVWQGEFAPGDSAGQIQIWGSVSMADSTLFSCELGGTAVSQYDNLAGGSGNVALDGTLDISLINDFVPSTCDSFVLVSGSTVTGQFDTVNFPPAPEGHLWRLFNNGSSLTLKLTCYPDVDGTCTLDLFDLLSYLNAFNANNPDAECDNNPGLNLFDILCFLNEFNAGC